jgi:hypothetical protein
LGLRNWLAKNVAGVGGYGDSMGRSTAENGLAIGRTLYLGHGTHAGAPTRFIFNNAETMIAQGYSVYCVDPSRMPPNEDSSQLSILTRAAGAAFAARVAMNAAQCFANPENLSNFRKSLGASNAAYIRKNSPDLSMELFTQFVGFQVPHGITKVLDLKWPGSGDLFGIMLLQISEQHKGASIGFQRNDVLGYDSLVVSLVEQTTSAIQQAAQEFSW